MLAALTAASCEGRNSGGTPLVSTVYNKESGKLEQLVSDRDGDGRAETRAFMDGAVLKRIEIDRNGDGVVDRWETYAGGRVAGPGATVKAPVSGVVLFIVTSPAIKKDGLLLAIGAL